MKRKLQSAVLVGLVALGIAGSAVRAQAQGPQGFLIGRLRVYDGVNNIVDERGKTVRIASMVTVYKDGVPIRTGTFDNWAASNYLTWTELPLGPIEVQIETKGYGKIIKRAILSKDAQTMLTVDSLGKQDELWGAGPSLYELENRIKAEEAEITALKAKIAELEKKP